jgi:hypothetical protein
MRVIGAKVASLDSGLEVMAQRGNGVGDLLDGSLDAFDDGASGAFGVGSAR